MESEICSNCGAEIKNGFLHPNSFLIESRVKGLNSLLGLTKESYCEKCFPNLNAHVKKIFNEYDRFISDYIHLVPVLTTHTPFGWNYKPLGIVTGQSVTGTGVISEFTSGFTDFFGQQSGSFIRKIANGEKMCLAQLRIKTVQMGGHAVIATDIDYGELGSIKGMIMVCAAGTAVELNDISILGDKQKILNELTIKSRWMKVYGEKWENSI